jgi:uncharacterized protein (DUF2252 family)
MRDPVAEFQTYNRAFARRNPELLRLKVERMAASPFACFRGTFHLFARDILERLYEAGPRVAGAEAELDLVGDIHSENFGTYRAEDGVHYDINDFDETTQGRFDFDVRRLATSFILAAQERGDALGDATQTGLAFLTAYTEAIRRLLKKGKPADLDVNAKTPSGSPAIDQLVRDADATRRKAFIEGLTETAQGKRRLVRTVRYFNLPEGERAQALRLLEDYGKRMPLPPAADYYQVDDVCGRVSGIGSMGRLRYVVMVNGKGSKDARNVLLEFKEARPSAYDLYRQRQTDGEALVNRAERVLKVQKLSQVASNPKMGFAVDGGASFQVRELGPGDRRLEVKSLKAAAELQGVARVQAGILARTHARAAARVVGVANPLAELNEVEPFCQRVLAFALAYADLARRDWKLFVGRRAELEDCEKWAAEPAEAAPAGS